MWNAARTLGLAAIGLMALFGALAIGALREYIRRILHSGGSRRA